MGFQLAVVIMCGNTNAFFVVPCSMFIFLYHCSFPGSVTPVNGLWGSVSTFHLGNAVAGNGDGAGNGGVAGDVGGAGAGVCAVAGDGAGSVAGSL